MDTNAKKLMFIINPVSGRRLGRRFLPEIISLFTQNGYLCTVFVTTKRLDATEFVKKYGKDFDIIVCNGGDGTFNETVSGLVSSDLKTPLGYIPSGSTNDFAICHHLSPDIMTAASDIILGTPHAFDVGILNGRPFSYVAAFGAFSWLSYTTSQTKKNILGHTAYILDGIKDLSYIKSEYLKLSTDTDTYEGDFLFGSVSNSTSIAGTVNLDSELVDLNDGILEVLLIRTPKSIGELTEIASCLLSQNFDACKNIIFTKSRSITVESPGSLDWSLDGELQPSGVCTKIETIHSGINVIINDASQVKNNNSHALSHQRLQSPAKQRQAHTPSK